MFRGVYVGLKDRSKASRSTATSEQKLWSIGHLVDLLLVPSWQDPGLLDRMLAARSVDDFVEGLEGHKKFNGALVFTHSLEYFFLLHHDRVSKGRPSLFNFALDEDKLDCHVRLGENSQVFLGFVNATSHGARSVPYDIHELAELVDALLPSSIIAEGGVHIELLPFKGKDASQTACKLVQVTQTLLTNRTGGKDRCREAAGLGRPRQSKPVALELMDVPCVPDD